MPSIPSWKERFQEARRRHPIGALVRMSRELVLCRQLHQLIRAGTPLPILFSDLQRANPNSARRHALARAAQRLSGGASLADALTQAPELFEPVTLELLRAGEETGTLEPTLERRVLQLERMRQIALKALVLFLYPAYLALAIIFLGPLLELGPALQAGANRDSLGSLYLLGVLRMLLLVGGSAAVLLSLPFIGAALGIQGGFDRLRLRLPLLGPVYRNLYTARFCSVLGGALGAGLEAGRSIRLAVLATSSPSWMTRTTEAETTVRHGESLSDTVGSLGMLDMDALGSVVIGERTGELPQVLERLGEEAWDLATRQMRTIVIIVLVLSVGAAIAIVVVKLLQVLLGTVLEGYRALDQIEKS